MNPQKYFLSKSLLRLSLDQFVVHNGITGATTTVFEGTASVVDVADTRHSESVHVPDAHKANTSSALVFREDRRLSSLDASSTGQGPAWVKAGVGLAGTVVGLVVSTANPLAGLGVFAAGAAAAQVTREGLTDQESPTGGVEETAELKAYGAVFPDAKKVLLQLTVALRKVAEAIGDSAVEAEPQKLKELGAKRTVIVEQLAPLQSHFASWVVSQTTKTLVDRREVSIEIGDLPTGAQLRAALAEERWWDEPGPVWLRWARDAGIAVTVDYEDVPPHEETAEEHDHQEICLSYRMGRAAVITTWALTRVHEPERHDAGGNEVAEEVGYRSVPQSRVHRRVVSGDSPVHHIDLSVDLFRSGKVRVVFNDLGEVSEIGGESSRLVAETAGSIPSAVQSSLEGGGKISAALVPGTTTAARLENALAVAKNRKELDPLINPKTPGADEQAKAELEAEVAIAELEARLALARQLAGNPGASVVINELSH